MTDSDIITLIIDDHRHVEEVFAQLEAGGHDAQQRRDLVDHMTAELVRHAVAEEQFMYPAARIRLDDGESIADHETAEHTDIEQALKALENQDVGEPLFESQLSDLMEQVRHHVREEENVLLPRLRDACGQEELDELGQQVLMAKSAAPTRPHPMTPDHPPANLLVDAGVGLVDKLRDRLTNRATL